MNKVLGKTSAFFAAEDTAISVKLPGNPSSIRVVKFDKRSRRVEDKIQDVGEIFQTDPPKCWLLVVESR